MGDWKPFWTDEVTIESGGRYPLLLNRFHDHLEEYLIKGIVSITDRLRYVSYCCWAIGDIEHNMKYTSYADFEEAFRRREGALAIGTYLLDPETVLGNYTIYGRDTMRGVVENINKVYDTSFRVLPSNPLGAFGQYYKGSLQNWGLTYVGEDEMIHLTDLGNELYEIMVSSYTGNEYYEKYKDKRKVPGTVLFDWAKINQYDNIVDCAHKKERDFYKNILFHLDTKDVLDGRRDTLTIYLECIAELEDKNREFDEQMIRNTVYYKKYYDNDNVLHSFQLSSFLDDTQFIWKLYELHVYYRWWISEFFRTFLRLLSESANGLTLEEVIMSIDSNSFNAVAAKYLAEENEYYNMKFGAFIDKVIEVSAKTDWLFEDILCIDSWNGKVTGFSQVCAGLIMVLALLYKEYQQIREDTRFLDIRVNLNEDFWFKDIIERIDGFREDTIPEVLKIILLQYVIRQHNIAMYEKRDLRRCWFTMSGDKYQYQADSSSIWRPAKHNIICNFLFDMGLISVTEGTFILTQEGRELYFRLKEEYYEE